jgi:hypothetical protein
MEIELKKIHYRQLRDIHMSKKLTETTKRAISVRLGAFLEEEIRRYENWKDMNKFRLNATRQKSVERRFIKRIQAMKIVIHFMSPNDWRTEDEPSFIVKKELTQKK